MGEGDDSFYRKGAEGYTSFCGHSISTMFSWYGGSFLDDEDYSIWRNDPGNVYMMDCGCGYSSGKGSGCS